jgi:hypothetical protein
LDDLEEEDKELLDGLISHPASVLYPGPSDAALAAQLPVVSANYSPSKARPNSVTYTLDPTTGQIAVTGSTFDIKDELKSLGARWNAEEKCWVFFRAAHEGAKKFFVLDDIPPPNTPITVTMAELRDIQAAAKMSSSKPPSSTANVKKASDSQPPPKPAPSASRPVRYKSTARKSAPPGSDSDDDDDYDSDEKKKKKKPAAKGTRKRKPAYDSGEEDDDDEKPKRARKAARK